VGVQRLLGFLSKRRRDDDLTDEIEAHLDLLTQENLRRGMLPDDARAAARREFGGVEQIKETYRDQRGWPSLDGLVQDLRYAFRTLRRDPAFTAVALASVAIGIAAATALATQLNAVFWKPFAVRQPDELRLLSWTARNKATPDGGFPYSAYVTLRDNTRSFASLACASGVRFPPLGDWGPVTIQLVSGNYFQTVGISAAIGRTITADDDRPDRAAPVAVISDSLWRRAFGRDPAVLGRTIRIKDTPFEIVGVMPAGFAGLNPMDPREVMVPYAAHAITGRLDPNAWNSCGRIVGRLQAGVSSDQAAAEAATMFRALVAANPPKAAQEPRLLLGDIGQEPNLVRLRQRTSTPLFLLLSTVTLMLLIVCANLAGLLLARGQARRREIATRLALGAGRGRIVRQLLTESLVLSCSGGIAGIGLAYVLTPLLPALLTQLSGNFTLNGQNPTLAIDVTPNLSVLGMSALAAIGVGILFGLVPAFRSSRLDLTPALKQTALAERGRLRLVPGKALVAAQIAFSMLLLIGAGLLIRTFMNLRAVPVGYEPERLLFVTIDPIGLPGQFVEESVSRLEAVPGVTAASASMWPLYNGGGTNDKLPICVAGGGQPVDVEQVLPRFFETWGVRLILGRDFQRAGSEPGAIVNETFVSTFLSGRNPIGQTIGMKGCPGTPRTIVGVVANHIDRQRAVLAPMVYVPYPSRAIEPTTLALRTAADPRPLVPVIRRIVAGLDTRIDGDVTTGVEYKNSKFAQERLLAALLIGFGAIALGICCVGIYGLLTYTVNRRTPEIGLRMALGAERLDVIGLIVWESLGSVAAGIVVGLVAALALTRVLESTLFGVSKRDPWTIVVAAILLLVTAAVAAFVPARRASRTDPMTALRCE